MERIDPRYFKHKWQAADEKKTLTNPYFLKDILLQDVTDYKNSNLFKN